MKTYVRNNKKMNEPTTYSKTEALPRQYRPPICTEYYWRFGEDQQQLFRQSKNFDQNWSSASAGGASQMARFAKDDLYFPRQS